MDAALHTLRSFSVNELSDPYLGIRGRTVRSDQGICFFWTGSELEFTVSGRELSVEVEVPEAPQVLCPWICIFLNDHLLQRLLLRRGRQIITIYDHLNYDEPKKIRVMKDSPALLQNAVCEGETLYTVRSIHTDGTFFPVPEKELKIELIGDSITSGEGLFGYPGLITEDLWFFTAQPEYHYGTMLAQKLNADLRIVTQAGWGVHIGYTNDPGYNMPSVYEQVCGVQTSACAASCGAQQPYDFAQWQPDLIIVNLGTNDAAAFVNPGYTDPETGRFWKMRRLENEELHPDDCAAICGAAVSFLGMLRKDNPAAKILWCYGMMGNDLEPTLRSAVRMFADPKVSYIALPDTLPGEFGSVDHPGILSHKKTADVLLSAVRDCFLSADICAGFCV